MKNPQEAIVLSRNAIRAKRRATCGLFIGVKSLVMMRGEVCGVWYNDDGSSKRVKKHKKRASGWKLLVGMTGFEPATSPSRTERATELRYIPMTRLL